LSTVTPNFNWPVPTSTDLVKDGATAIEALGDSIDASLVDLKGGTSGQVLSKNSNTDMDFVWVTSDDANAIQNTIVDAKGDLIAATAADTPARLAVGTNGQVLTADSTAATGLAWATASGGSTNVAGKNGVLNSNFSVWQRGTSIAQAGGFTYSADRWVSSRNGFDVGTTMSRQVTGDTTNLPFIQYCARVQRNSGTTATTGVFFSQSFENINSTAFMGKTVTFSFYARAGANYSSASNALTVKVDTGTGTDQSIINTWTGAASAIGGNQTATLTTTWQRFTYTGTASASGTQIGFYFSYTPVGTAGANDYFEVTGVQLEIAGSASAYSPNTSTYQAELAACQRYFYMLANGNGKVIGTAFAYSGTQIGVVVNLPVQLRTDATLVSTTGTDYYGFYRNSGTDLLNSFTLGTSGNIAVELYNNSNISSTAGDAGMVFTNNASASIALSAEL
jgi:hypothetical protein